MEFQVKTSLGLLALLAWAACCTITAQAATIHLRIVDERGAAVTGAAVLVSWSEDSMEKMLTDREGRVRVCGSSPHNQDVLGGPQEGFSCDGSAR
jgi:hypothetical protein